MGYLDQTGLTYLWGKIKALLSNVQALIPAGSYIWSGAAITAKRGVIQASNGKAYPLTNTSIAIPMETSVGFCSTAYASGSAMAPSDFLLKGDFLTSEIFSGCTVPTFTQHGRYYAQFSVSNDVLYSDAKIVKEGSFTAGKYYLYLGHCRDSTHIELAGHHSIRGVLI